MQACPKRQAHPKKQALRLDAVRPVSSNVAWVRWRGDRTGDRMVVSNTFMKAFVTEYASTADAYRLKADLVEQHSLNDGASLDHVVGLARETRRSGGDTTANDRTVGHRKRT